MQQNPGYPGDNGSAASGGPTATDELTGRTAVITARLKQVYRKSVYPVEKRYKYDYFYESPLMTDVEFDGEITLRAKN
jgi:hypothetical protein